MVGAGNLAWHLGSALKNAGYEIEKIWGRTPENTRKLAEFLTSDFTLDIKEIPDSADFYFILVPDRRIQDFVHSIPNKNRFLIHCSGATALKVLEGGTDHYGVLYPVQSFSKELELNFSQIPLLIEANNPENLIRLTELASSLSEFTYEMSSENRVLVHLAAVFANNFTNHLIGIGEALLEEKEISPQLLFPLIAETVRKVFTLGPGPAQTGPALRNDQITMDKHLELLKNKPGLLNLYKELSQNIIHSVNNGC